MQSEHKGNSIRKLTPLILSVVILTSVWSSSFAQTQLATLADSWSGVHTFVVFNPLGMYTASYVQSIATRFDFGWSHGQYRNEIKAGNPSFINSVYVDGTQGYGTLEWYQQNHPDWILYKCDRTPLLAYDYNAVIGDFTNPAYVDWKWQTVILPLTNNTQEGIDFDNSLLDNDFFPGLGETQYGQACGVYDRPGHWVQKFAGLTSYAEVTDPAYTNAFIAFISEIRNRLHAAAKPKLLITNSDPKIVFNSPSLRTAFINAVDAVLTEGGTYGPEWVGDSRKLWLGHIKFVQDMDAAGKGTYPITAAMGFTESSLTGTAAGKAWTRFTLASYLLAKGHHSGISIIAGIDPDTSKGIWATEFDAANSIGTPCGPMSQVAGTTGTENGLFMREYTGGVSIVNASSSTSYVATLPAGTYKDLYNNSVSSPLTMPFTTGNVLLKSSGVGCSNGTTAPITSAPSVTNTPPVIASAGPDQTITLSTTATLRASANDDNLPNGTLSYQWNVISAGSPISNGIYMYNPTPAFPTDTYHSNSYGVDVAFVPAGASSPITLYASSSTVASSSDPNPIEIGLRFKSDVNGVINGIRFYKGPQNTGTHTASLWTNSGALLARAASTNETATGWQQINFATPVSITANTLYIASYHTTSGYYASVMNYFTSQINSGVLHAPADGSLSGGTATFASPASATTQATFSAPGVYIIRLTVSDGVLTSTRDVTVTVNAAPASAPSVSTPITVNAGTNQTTVLPNAATLTATASGGSGALTYQWSIVSGTGATLATPNSASTQATFSTAGTYTFRVTASDGQNSATSDVTVTVSSAAGVTLIISRDGEVLGGKRTPVKAWSDNNLGQKLELIIDGQSIATVPSTTLSYMWDTRRLSGSHTVKAILYDSQNAIASKTVTVTVY